MSSVKSFTAQPGDERLTAAIVSDSLDSLGYRNQVLRTRLTPLTTGATILGRASTVQFAPAFTDDAHDPYAAAINYIDDLGTNDIAMIATDSNNSSGYWGELFSAAAKGRGAAGIITDGNVRDCEKIRKLDFPTFSAGHRPIDFRARMAIVAAHERVHICGVHIDHRDLVIADDDGIVVIPQVIEAETLEAARRRASAESAVLIDLLAGASLRTVWDKYRVL
jgi:regulator of RNase E activity RraA